MVWKHHEYDDIPGTYVFDGKTANSAYGLNKLLFSFNHAENREAFERDRAAYADRFGLSPEQTEALEHYWQLAGMDHILFLKKS